MIDLNKMPKIYQAQQIESDIYRDWTEKGYFHSEPDPAKKPYTIVMPPPNITGQLHMGHALNNTLQDVLIRWRRMQGFCTLLLPGTDHASIATEARIVEAMAAEGLTKDMIGRAKFLERAWEWKRVYGGRIVEQLKRLGSSCDWSRERFTMDEGLSRAVTEVFARLYEKGLIYRGERIINWCPVCRTSISDAEVEHSEKDGNFWYIKYPVKDSNEFITVATTRPETMLGDTAVAVNPEDSRFARLVGMIAVLPLLDREIPIIADDYVDKDYGTGAVKITPAHDPNDYEVGQRHELPSIKAMTDDAKMSDETGPYAGMDRYAARKQVVEDLAKLGLLVKIEPHKHSVGECYRCGTVIEPMLSRQWFVKMKPLAEPAIEVVRSGELEFVPDNFTKIYFNWMENIRDWCISRQLWWGHRIPAYYCGDCGHMVVSRTAVKKCPNCASESITQDPDTLDTWFSSALWPFSTLGWPDETEDLKYFYPTDVLVTAYDIIFFWVARMIFSGLEDMGEKPFKYVLIHGLIRDEEGRKMSKSLGNGIDPLEIMDIYGTDALRFAMTSGNSAGNDMRFMIERVEAGRNFANKIWNAARFALSNFDEEPDFSKVDPANFNLADKWILTRMNLLISEVTANLEKFETGIAIQKIYEFIWDEFCDWYVELVKPRLYDHESKSRTEALCVLNRTLGTAMKLLHPFMPFITESVYMNLVHDDASIMISAWPEYDAATVYEKEAREMVLIMDAVKSVRNIRAGMNVPPSKKAKIIINAADAQTADIFRQGASFFEKLAWASETVILENSKNIEGNNVTAVVSGAQIAIPLDELVDAVKEIERLTKERDGLMKEIERANAKLTNEGFISKAPPQVIEEEKAKLTKYTEMHEMVREMLKKLGDG